MAQVTCEVKGNIAYITFDHVAARNAMTVGMYQSLQKICEDLAQNSDVRVAILRGAGGKAFVSGSDIARRALRGRVDDCRRADLGDDRF